MILLTSMARAADSTDMSSAAVPVWRTRSVLAALALATLSTGIAVFVREQPPRPGSYVALAAFAIATVPLWIRPVIIRPGLDGYLSGATVLAMALLYPPTAVVIAGSCVALGAGMAQHQKTGRADATKAIANLGIDLFRVVLVVLAADLAVPDGSTGASLMVPVCVVVVVELTLSFLAVALVSTSMGAATITELLRSLRAADIGLLAGAYASFATVAVVLGRESTWLLLPLAFPVAWSVVGVESGRHAQLASQIFAELDPLTSAIRVDRSTAERAVVAAATRAAGTDVALLSAKPAGLDHLLVEAVDSGCWLVATQPAAGISAYRRSLFRTVATVGRGSFATLQHVSEMTAAASVDGLTGLLNRRGFDLELENRLRDDVDGAFALLFIDLDGFKAVNDTHGHPAGDELLKAASGRLVQLLRPTDAIGRPGGDEFCVLAGPLDPTSAGVLADRIIHALGLPFRVEAGNVAVGASVGVAMWPADGRSPLELVAAADQAMYEAKGAGKNQWRSFGPSSRPC